MVHTTPHCSFTEPAIHVSCSIFVKRTTAMRTEQTFNSTGTACGGPIEIHVLQ